MKRLAAISLLALLLYNAFGYYILFAYEQEQARIISLHDLPESAFQVMKFNLAIYTSVQNTEFEYVNNEITVEGKTYHIVKKRIENDSLCMYYLRNFKQDELRNNLNQIVESQTISKESNTTSPAKQLLKSFIKDYIADDYKPTVLVPISNIIVKSSKISIAPSSSLLSPYLSLNSPPPEVA